MKVWNSSKIVTELKPAMKTMKIKVRAGRNNFMLRDGLQGKLFLSPGALQVPRPPFLTSGSLGGDVAGGSFVLI